MSYVKDFVRIYMELLPQDPSINRYVHRTIALTIGGALQIILSKFKYDLMQELSSKKIED